MPKRQVPVGMEETHAAAVARRLPHVLTMYKTNYLRAVGGEASYREVIKAKCLDCCCQQRGEITKCTVLACPLWLYRPYQDATMPSESARPLSTGHLGEEGDEDDPEADQEDSSAS